MNFRVYWKCDHYSHADHSCMGYQEIYRRVTCLMRGMLRLIIIKAEAVANAVKRLQYRDYDATHCKVFNLRDGHLYAVIRIDVNDKIFVTKQIAAGLLAPSDEDPTRLASVTKKRVSPYEKVTMYRSEDGKLFESIDGLKTHIKKRRFMAIVEMMSELTRRILQIG